MAKGQPSASLKIHIEDRLGHDRRYAIDDSKIAAELGFKRTHSLDDGLEHTVRWYLDNADWWRHCLSAESGRFVRMCAPGRIRTSDPLIRSQVLYPAELRARGNGAM